jgi:hypothetical protein
MFQYVVPVSREVEMRQACLVRSSSVFAVNGSIRLPIQASLSAELPPALPPSPPAPPGR